VLFLIAGLSFPGARRHDSDGAAGGSPGRSRRLSSDVNGALQACGVGLAGLSGGAVALGSSPLPRRLRLRLGVPDANQTPAKSGTNVVAATGGGQSQAAGLLRQFPNRVLFVRGRAPGGGASGGTSSWWTRQTRHKPVVYLGRPREPWSSTGPAGRVNSSSRTARSTRARPTAPQDYSVCPVPAAGAEPRPGEVFPRTGPAKAIAR